MIPDYLIIDEIRRKKEKSWQPEPLPLPLYIPNQPSENEDDNKPNDEKRPSSGVIIINL